MNAVSRREESKQDETPLGILEQMRYRSPVGFPDPRSYDTYHDRRMFPKRYLDSIGIDVFVDHILNQFSPKQIAITYGISQSYLLRWVHVDQERKDKWEWALEQEADNMMFDARDKLERAYVPADKALDKAEKLANHNRLMAKGFGQKRWGQKVDVSGLPSGATVTYNFNVALLPGQEEKLIRDKSVVAEQGKQENLDSFNFNNFLGSGGQLDLAIPDEKMGFEEAKAQET